MIYFFKMIRKFVVSIFLVLFLFKTSFSQTDSKVGLTAIVQDVQLGFNLPIWVGDKTVLAPSIDFTTAEDVGTDIGLGVGFRFYRKVEKLSPYAGIRIGALINSPSNNNALNTEQTTDWIFGPIFGGEYFLSERFSFGVEGQGNIAFSDEESNRFGNPGNVNFNLGTVFMATIYF